MHRDKRQEIGNKLDRKTHDLQDLSMRLREGKVTSRKAGERLNDLAREVSEIVATFHPRNDIQRTMDDLRKLTEQDPEQRGI